MSIKNAEKSLSSQDIRAAAGMGLFGPIGVFMSTEAVKTCKDRKHSQKITEISGKFQKKACKGDNTKVILNRS